ncbi:ComF family protein [Bordetella parapertussis]
MTHIIAHSRRWLARLPSDCPLCGLRAAGGRPCEPCAAEAMAALGPATPRCPCCAVRLAPRARHCADCLRLRPAYQRVVAALDYAGPYRGLISRYKTACRHELALALADLMLRAIRQADPPLRGPCLLVPVPASAASLRRRGFNPAAELAAALAARLGWPLARTQLRPARVPAGRQTLRGRRDRLRGATGRWRALLAAGAGRVIVLAAARTPASHG